MRKGFHLQLCGADAALFTDQGDSATVQRSACVFDIEKLLAVDPPTQARAVDFQLQIIGVLRFTTKPVSAMVVSPSSALTSRALHPAVSRSASQISHDIGHQAPLKKTPRHLTRHNDLRCS